MPTKSKGLIVKVNEYADSHERHLAPGLYLIFSPGTRPDRATIQNFVQAHPAVALTLDPSVGPSLHLVGVDNAANSAGTTQDGASAGDRVWVELVHNGLTFDLEGLLPGDPFALTDVAHKFDFSAESSVAEFEAVRLVPGNHLAGAEASLPVLRGLLALARDLVQHFEQIQAIVWPPSSSIIGRRFFESTATAWLDGGAFPALGLTSFREMVDGGLQSVGLSFLIGQELRIEPGLASDKVAATRLGVRLVNLLVLTGRVERSEQITGPDGQRLQLDPSPNGKFIRVWAT